MAFLDIILGGILIYSLVKGIWKGLFVELASLVALVLGIYIAIRFSNLIRVVIMGWIDWNPKYIEITAFAITFILVVIGVTLLAKFFTTIAKFAGLGWINKITGGIFSVLKMILILSFALHYFLKLNNIIPLVKQETIAQSLFFNPILQVSATIFPMIEEWFPK